TLAERAAAESSQVHAGADRVDGRDRPDDRRARGRDPRSAFQRVTIVPEWPSLTCATGTHLAKGQAEGRADGRVGRGTAAARSIANFPRSSTSDRTAPAGTRGRAPRGTL